MSPVNGVGEPGAGEPHARFEVAGAGKGMTWPRSPGVAQPTGKPAEGRPWDLPSDIITLACSRPDSGWWGTRQDWIRHENPSCSLGGTSRSGSRRPLLAAVRRKQV